MLYIALKSITQSWEACIHNIMPSLYTAAYLEGVLKFILLLRENDSLGLTLSLLLQHKSGIMAKQSI